MNSEKELNKLIERIAFPLRYDDETGDILDSDGQWVCTVHCGLEFDGNLIAHALNNLNRENHAISRNSDNLQPKEGEFYCAYGCKEPCKECEEAAVSGERTGEGAAMRFHKEKITALDWWDEQAPEDQLAFTNEYLSANCEWNYRTLSIGEIEAIWRKESGENK